MYLTFFLITAEYHITSNTTSVLIVSLRYVIPNICAWPDQIPLREGLPSSQFQVVTEMVMPFLQSMYSCQIQPMKSRVNITTNNIMNPFKQTFVNLQFYFHIELYSLF